MKRFIYAIGLHSRLPGRYATYPQWSITRKSRHTGYCYYNYTYCTNLDGVIYIVIFDSLAFFESIQTVADRVFGNKKQRQNLFADVSLYHLVPNGNEHKGADLLMTRKDLPIPEAIKWRDSLLNNLSVELVLEVV